MENLDLYSPYYASGFNTPADRIFQAFDVAGGGYSTYAPAPAGSEAAGASAGADSAGIFQSVAGSAGSLWDGFSSFLGNAFNTGLGLWARNEELDAKTQVAKAQAAAQAQANDMTPLILIGAVGLVALLLLRK